VHEKALGLLLLGLPACSAGPEPAPTSEPAPTPAPAPAPVESASVKPGINDNFLSEELDVGHYVGIFEGESREIAVHRAAVAATLDLEPGMEVADVGAGTGLYMDILAEGVGSGGRVYAVDISPGFFEHLQRRARENGLDQVMPVLCTERSVRLPEASVDVAFVCDTYHHFEYPLSSTRSIYEALRPGGRLVVVDFERIPGVTREWLLDHVRADKATFRAEIEGAGFEFVDEVEIEGLEENYVLRFRRP
jgi:SAM-dependent methyltransferase